jgi:hypothetical protein
MLKVTYSKNMTGGTNVRIPRELNNQAMPLDLREKLGMCFVVKVTIQYVDGAGRVYLVEQEA